MLVLLGRLLFACVVAFASFYVPFVFYQFFQTSYGEHIASERSRIATMHLPAPSRLRVHVCSKLSPTEARAPSEAPAITTDQARSNQGGVEVKAFGKRLYWVSSQPNLSNNVAISCSDAQCEKFQETTFKTRMKKPTSNCKRNNTHHTQQQQQ